MDTIEILVPIGRKVKQVTVDGILLDQPISINMPAGFAYEVYRYRNPLGYEPIVIAIEFDRSS